MYTHSFIHISVSIYAADIGNDYISMLLHYYMALVLPCCCATAAGRCLQSQHQYAAIVQRHRADLANTTPSLRCHRCPWLPYLLLRRCAHSGQNSCRSRLALRSAGGHSAAEHLALQRERGALSSRMADRGPLCHVRPDGATRGTGKLMVSSIAILGRPLPAKQPKMVSEHNAFARCGHV